MSEWARREGVHYQRARRWFRDGQLPVPAVRTATGTILLQLLVGIALAGRTVVYALVSSHDQRTDLHRQVARASGPAAISWPSMK
jgi:putative resolvase